jgi:hypothetical protein
MMNTPAARPAPAVPTQSESTSKLWVAAIAGGVAGLVAVGGGKLGVRIAGGMIAGAFVGLIPLTVARSRGDTRFADTAMTCCMISGGVLGILLAAPVAIVLTIVAATRKRPS